MECRPLEVLASARHCAWGLLCLALVALAPTQSQAYKRSETSDRKLLYWGKYPITYHLHSLGSPGLDVNATLSAIRSSFNTWTLPDCTCLKFEDGGITNDTTLGYDQDNPDQNINIVLFRTQSWDHSPQAVAVTSTVFKRTDGEIVAFDMELNQANFSFGLSGESNKMDIQNTVTHEVGHVIGLDHSNISRAAMFAAGRPGETSKRTLHTDDLNALCDLYPKTAAGTCEVINPNPDTGCQCNAFSPKHFPISLLLIPLAFLFWRRTRQSPSAKQSP